MARYAKEPVVDRSALTDRILKEDLIKSLKESSENGLLGEEDVQAMIEQLNAKERKKILARHAKGHIIYNADESYNGRCWTRVYDPTKKDKRRRISSKTMEGLAEKLAAYYKKVDGRPDTFAEAYELWVAKQKSLVSDNTLYKYQTDFNRFFREVPFYRMPLEEVTEEVICEFIHDTVIRLNLPKTACKRLVEYIKSTIMYARRKGFIDTRPEEFIKAADFYKFCRPVAEKTTISDDDLQKLLNLLKEDHEKQPEYIPTYAVEFASYTYTRVSELSALRWEDVDFENKIVHFWKSEKWNRLTGEYTIGETKNGKHRMFPLDHQAERLLLQLRNVQTKMGVDSEYVFADRNGRIHSGVISSCIKNKCRMLGIKEIGIHALRRKGNSVMRSNGLSNVAAASLLGNSKEVNDQYYTFDEVDFESKRAAVEAANRRLHKSFLPENPDPDPVYTAGSPREPKNVISMFEFKKRRNA